MATGSAFLPSTHWISHCVSCGQTRPQMAGRLFLSLSISTARHMSPSARALMNSGMRTCTGQPSTHWGFLHCRQRVASSTAISIV